MVKRKVYIGSTKISDWIPAEHWAVKVGNTWYEIAGAGKSGKGQRNIVRVSYGGDKSKGGAVIVGCSVGTTERDDEDIESFNDRWLKKHPTYKALWGNCQIYARELVTYCCGLSVAWPKGLIIQSSAPTGSARMDTYFRSDTNRGNAGLGFTTFEGSVGPLSGRVGGPRVGYQVSSDEKDPGIFVDIEACRAEANLTYAKAAFAPNVSTGIGIRNNNFEASFCGTGIGVGEDGLKLKTPLFEATVCSIQ